MLKHIEDQGDLNLVINDEGEMLLVCSACRKIWTGSLQEMTTDLSKRRIRGFMHDLEASPEFMVALHLDDEAAEFPL